MTSRPAHRVKHYLPIWFSTLFSFPSPDVTVRVKVILSVPWKWNNGTSLSSFYRALSNLWIQASISLLPILFMYFIYLSFWGWWCFLKKMYYESIADMRCYISFRCTTRRFYNSTHYAMLSLPNLKAPALHLKQSQTSFPQIISICSLIPTFNFSPTNNLLVAWVDRACACFWEYLSAPYVRYTFCFSSLQVMPIL